MAKYVIDSNNAASVSTNSEITFIIRTNRASGQVFYLGQDVNDDTGTFIAGQMVNGTFGVDVRLGGKKVHHVVGTQKVNDNIAHVVTVNREGNNIGLYVDGKHDGDINIASPFEHPLLVDHFMLGNNKSVEEKEVFKGTLQDVRVNGNPVLLSQTQPSFLQQPLFGTLIDNNNLLEGTVSDAICSVQSPCIHGSCTETFNDYECACDKGYMGRDCESIDYCSTSPCPLNAQCINTHGGFVCKSLITVVTCIIKN